MKTIKDLIKKTEKELNPYDLLKDIDTSIDVVENNRFNVFISLARHEADFKNFLSEYIITHTLIENDSRENSDWFNWIERQDHTIRDSLYNSAFLYYLKVRKSNLEHMILKDINCYEDTNSNDSKKPETPYFRYLTHKSYDLLDLMMSPGIIHSYRDKKYLGMILDHLPQNFPMLFQERVRIELKRQEFRFEHQDFYFQILEIISGTLPELCTWAKRRDFANNLYFQGGLHKILIK